MARYPVIMKPSSVSVALYRGVRNGRRAYATLRASAMSPAYDAASFGVEAATNTTLDDHTLDGLHQGHLYITREPYVAIPRQVEAF